MMKIQAAFNLPSTKKLSIFKFILALNFLLLLSFFAAAQKIETGNFFVTNYSRSFLNTVSGNWSILQDPDGVIYIGNNNGILVYDGQKIRRVLDKEGLPKLASTRALSMDRKKTIYTIIGNEFGYIEKNEFGESIFKSLSENLSQKDQVNSTLWGAGIINDTVVFQSEKSVYLYKYKKLIKVQHFSSILHTAKINKNGAFLRIWGEGLFKMTGGEFKLIPSTKDVFAQNRIDEQYELDNGDNLLVSRNNGLWYLKKDGTLIKAKSDQLDKFVKENESYTGGKKLINNIISIVTLKGGLLFIDDQLQIRSILNTSNGLDFDYVTSTIQDRVGDVWATSDNIFKVSFDTSMTYFSTINKLHGSVNTIKRIDGKLYVRTSRDLYDFVPKKKLEDQSVFEENNVNELGDEILTFDDQVITTNNYTIKTTKNRITKLLSPIYRSNGTIRSKLNPSLILTANSAVGLLIHQYKNGQWKQVALSNKNTIPCFNLVEEVPGTLVLQTRNGLYKYEYNNEGQGKYTKLEMDTAFTTLKRLVGQRTVNGNINLFTDSLNHFYKVDLINNKVLYTGFTIDSFVNKTYWTYTYNTDSKNGWMVTENGLYKTYFNFKDGFLLDTRVSKTIFKGCFINHFGLPEENSI